MALRYLGYAALIANANLDAMATSLAAAQADATAALYFTPAGAGASVRTVQTVLRERVRLLDYGAPVDGVSDATAALTNAVNALGAGGGDVEIPPMRFLINYTAIKSNVRLVGQGSGLRIAVVTASLGSFDANLPTLSVGDGNAFVTGVAVENLAFNGNNAQKYGIKVNGASRCRFSHFSIAGYTRQGLYITNSATQPTFYNYYTDFTIHTGTDPLAVGVDGFYNNTGGQFTSSQFFENGNVESTAAASSLYAMRGDAGTAGIAAWYLSNVWIECGDGTGLMSANGWQYLCSNVQVDAGSSSLNVAVEIDANVQVGQRYMGSLSIDGKLKTPAGNSPASVGGPHWPNLTTLINPWIQQSIYFSDSSLSPYAQQTYTDNGCSIGRIGDGLFFTHTRFVFNYTSTIRFKGPNVIAETSNADGDVVLQAGSGGAAPTADRNSILLADVPSSAGFRGSAFTRYARANALVFRTGVFTGGASGIKEAVDDYVFQNATNTLVAVLTQAGRFKSLAGASFGVAALATNATTGHVFLTSCAGAPTGVPAAIPTGQVAFHYDSTNNKIYVYNGAWRSTAALT